MSDAEPKPIEVPGKEELEKMDVEQRYKLFLRMLHARNQTVDRLALLATKQKNSRTHVLQVLSGKRKGECTWARLVDFLTKDELAVLGKAELIVAAATNKVGMFPVEQ